MNIRHSKPWLGKEEIAAVAAVIRSGQLAQAGMVRRLEARLSTRAAHAYGIAVSSGTAALYVALRALGAGPGREVVIPSYVCTALLNAVVMTGAKAVLADVDRETGNLTPGQAGKKLTKRTAATVVAHMFGVPADAAGIERLGVPVVEDCAQCVGIRNGAGPIGGQTAISVFSFYATKLIAAGEGGMVATSDVRLKDRIVALREYDKQDSWAPAFNFKLSDVHAALALAQLKKLQTMLRMRNAAADHYRAALSDAGPGFLLPPGGHRVYQRFVVRVPGTAEAFAARLRERGIECGSPVFKPLHRYLGQSGFPNADALWQTSLSLPLYPGFGKKEATCVAKRLLRLIGGYS